MVDFEAIITLRAFVSATTTASPTPTISVATPVIEVAIVAIPKPAIATA